MCDVQAKLIAWLDRELSSDEAAGVERHIEGCNECRSRLAAYEQVSNTFDVYCDAVMAAKMRRRVPRWVHVLASAAVAAVVMFLAFSRTHVEPPTVIIPTITAASVALPETPELESAPRKTIHRRQPVAPVHVRAAKQQPMDTAAQIALPAEAQLSTAAHPTGMNILVA